MNFRINVLTWKSANRISYTKLGLFLQSANVVSREAIGLKILERKWCIYLFLWSLIWYLFQISRFKNSYRNWLWSFLLSAAKRVNTVNTVLAFVSKISVLIRASANTIIDISNTDPEELHKLELLSEYRKRDYIFHLNFYM